MTIKIRPPHVIDQAVETTNIDTTVTCATCEACCCKLQVLLMAGDDVPNHLAEYDQWNTASMRRLPDGWCAALSRDTLRCRIYSRRPAVCREYAMGGSDCIEERADPKPLNRP